VSDLARTQERDGEAKEWTVRAVLVLQSPRAVFAALRDRLAGRGGGPVGAGARLVLLGGMALLLLTPRGGENVLDSSDYDGMVFAIWLFIVGGVMGAAVYWAVGAILYGATSWLGSLGSYRRARHLVGYALAPLALSLWVVLPLRLAFFGGDAFRSGGRRLGDARADRRATGLGVLRLVGRPRCARRTRGSRLDVAARARGDGSRRGVSGRSR